MNKYVRKVAKSIVAGGVAFCGTLGTALADGQVVGQEWTGIIAATLVALGAVWGIRNANPVADDTRHPTTGA